MIVEEIDGSLSEGFLEVFDCENLHELAHQKAFLCVVFGVLEVIKRVWGMCKLIQFQSDLCLSCGVEFAER